MEVVLVIYGSIDQVTGGYIYDRKVVERLRAYGVGVRVYALRTRPYFWTPVQGLTAAVRDLLRKGKEERRLGVVDELTHSSFSISLLFRFRPISHVVTLVHHLRSEERIGPV